MPFWTTVLGNMQNDLRATHTLYYWIMILSNYNFINFVQEISLCVNEKKDIARVPREWTPWPMDWNELSSVASTTHPFVIHFPRSVDMNKFDSWVTLLLVSLILSSLSTQILSTWRISLSTAKLTTDVIGKISAHLDSHNPRTFVQLVMGILRKSSLRCAGSRSKFSKLLVLD